MAKAFLTTRTLVESVKESLNEVPYYSSIDYMLSNGCLELLCDEFDIYFKTTYGGSEGIYTDIIISGDFGHDGINDFCICTIKTLGETNDDFRGMTSLATEFVIKARDYKHENSELIYRKGCKVNGYTKEGKICLELYVNTIEKAREYIKQHSTGKMVKAVIVDCYTLDEVETISLK